MTPTEKLIAEARELANAVENCIGGDNCDGCKLKSYMLCEVDRKTVDSLIALCDALEETQKTIEQTWEWDMYKAAQKEIERLRKDLAALASESVKRDIALAKLEAEVMAAIEAQNAQRWIPVSEGLPPTYQNEEGEPIEFNVMLPNATEATTLCFNGSQWFEFDWSNGRVSGYFTVTHWRPLPMPPEKGTAK